MFLDKVGIFESRLLQKNRIHKSSCWTDIVKSNKQLNDADSIRRLVGCTVVKRDIAVKHSGDKYSFTKAYKLFIDFAKDSVADKN